MSEAAAILDVYDDLAVEVVSDNVPNTVVDMPYSNMELSENICKAMDWEDFDILARHEFAEIEKSGEAKVVLAYAFLSFLRWRLFDEATRRGIGDADLNTRFCTYAEYWFIRLVKRWKFLSTGTPQTKWLN